MLNLGPLVVVLVITAVTSTLMLQSVLRQLDHVNQQGWRIVDDVNRLSIAIDAAQVDLYELQLDRQVPIDRLTDSVNSIESIANELRAQNTSDIPEAAPLIEQIRKHIPDVVRQVGALAGVKADAQVSSQGTAALSAANALRQETLPLSRIVREHAHREQEEAMRQFRWLVMGLGLTFIVVINLAIVILARMASMVLRPVRKLVEATRELARERLDHRVNLEEHDEFDELAHAYNTLAEHLQETEKRRIEVLSQVALALNHELNNAMAAIEFQLSLLSRRASQDPKTELRLRTIHDGLTRMKDTVQSLKSVRRIVLTDYAQGVKMLDLVRSVRAEESVSPVSAAKQVSSA